MSSDIEKREALPNVTSQVPSWGSGMAFSTSSGVVFEIMPDDTPTASSYKIYIDSGSAGAEPTITFSKGDLAPSSRSRKSLTNMPLSLPEGLAPIDWLTLPEYRESRLATIADWLNFGTTEWCLGTAVVGIDEVYRLFDRRGTDLATRTWFSVVVWMSGDPESLAEGKAIVARVIGLERAQREFNIFKESLEGQPTRQGKRLQTSDSKPNGVTRVAREA